jgi:hypothetical protein
MEVRFTAFMYFIHGITASLQELCLQQNSSGDKPFGNRTEYTFGIGSKDFAILHHVSLRVICHARLNVNASLCIKCGNKSSNVQKANLV